MPPSRVAIDPLETMPKDEPNRTAEAARRLLTEFVRLCDTKTALRAEETGQFARSLINLDNKSKRRRAAIADVGLID